MAERLDRTERLLNLLFAFMSTTQPMSRAQVREMVAGYAEGSSDEAFERMFERDKDELRSLGIPVTTMTNASGEVDGYLIPRESYALKDVAFTSAELSALTLAANAWDEAVFAPAASMALRKLETTHPGADRIDRFAVDVHIDASEVALSPVISLLNAGTAMQFDYRKAGAIQAERRTVTPMTLVSRYGHWYLAGVDHDRQEVRVFRLSRIEGAVKPAGARVATPSDLDVFALIDAGEGSEHPGTVRLRVQREQAMSLRKLGTMDGDVLTIEYSDEASVLRDIVAAGSAAIVLDPPELQLKVRDALDRIARAHGGTS